MSGPPPPPPSAPPPPPPQTPSASRGALFSQITSGSVVLKKASQKTKTTVIKYDKDKRIDMVNDFISKILQENVLQVFIKYCPYYGHVDSRKYLTVDFGNTNPMELIRDLFIEHAKEMYDELMKYPQYIVNLVIDAIIKNPTTNPFFLGNDIATKTIAYGYDRKEVDVLLKLVNNSIVFIRTKIIPHIGGTQKYSKCKYTSNVSNDSITQYEKIKEYCKNNCKSVYLNNTCIVDKDYSQSVLTQKITNQSESDIMKHCIPVKPKILFETYLAFISPLSNTLYRNILKDCFELQNLAMKYIYFTYYVDLTNEIAHEKIKNIFGLTTKTAISKQLSNLRQHVFDFYEKSKQNDNFEYPYEICNIFDGWLIRYITVDGIDKPTLEECTDIKKCGSQKSIQRRNNVSGTYPYIPIECVHPSISKDFREIVEYFEKSIRNDSNIVPLSISKDLRSTRKYKKLIKGMLLRYPNIDKNIIINYMNANGVDLRNVVLPKTKESLQTMFYSKFADLMASSKPRNKQNLINLFSSDNNNPYNIWNIIFTYYENTYDARTRKLFSNPFYNEMFNMNKQIDQHVTNLGNDYSNFITTTMNKYINSYHLLKYNVIFNEDIGIKTTYYRNPYEWRENIMRLVTHFDTVKPNIRPPISTPTSTSTSTSTSISNERNDIILKQIASRLFRTPHVYGDKDKETCNPLFITSDGKSFYRNDDMDEWTYFSKYPSSYCMPTAQDIYDNFLVTKIPNTEDII